MKLRTWPTGEPRRTPCGAAGSDLVSSLAQLVEAGGAQRIAGDVLHVRRQIANDALRRRQGLASRRRARQIERASLGSPPGTSWGARSSRPSEGANLVPVALAAAQVKDFGIAPARQTRSI